MSIYEICVAIFSFLGFFGSLAFCAFAGFALRHQAQKRRQEKSFRRWLRGARGVWVADGDLNRESGPEVVPNNATKPWYTSNAPS